METGTVQVNGHGPDKIATRLSDPELRGRISDYLEAHREDEMDASRLVRVSLRYYLRAQAFKERTGKDPLELAAEVVAQESAALDLRRREREHGDEHGAPGGAGSG